MSLRFLCPRCFAISQTKEVRLSSSVEFEEQLLLSLNTSEWIERSIGSVILVTFIQVAARANFICMSFFYDSYI